MIKITWNEINRRSKAVGWTGGKPNLSATGSYPICKRCGKKLAYYFTMSINEVVKDHFLSLFYCIQCTGSETPELPANLNQPVDSRACEQLQQEYRIFIHPDETWSGELFSPLVERQIFSTPSKTEQWGGSHIGGLPSDQELVDSKCGKFIMQLREFNGLRFEVKEGSPPQQAYRLFDDDPEFPERGYYKLFNEIPAYFYLNEDLCAFVITGRF